MSFEFSSPKVENQPFSTILFIGRDYHVTNGCLPSASDRIRKNRDAVGTDLVGFTMQKIQIGSRPGESGRIRLETGESGCFLNNI